MIGFTNTIDIFKLKEEKCQVKKLGFLYNNCVYFEQLRQDITCYSWQLVGLER